MEPSPAGNSGRPTIVAGFDGSPSGLDAAALGRWLAEATGAKLVVANVYPYDPVAAPAVALEPAVEDALRRRARAVLEGAADVLGGLDWTPVVIGAIPPARGLLELAAAHAADLLIVGASHRHGLGRALPGPTAVKLLHGAPCAVAVAPAGWLEGEHERAGAVGAGFDGSPESQLAMRAAARLARCLRTDVRALAVLQPPNPAHPWFAVTAHGYREIVGELREDLRRRLEHAASPLGDEATIRLELVDGDPADVLARASASLELLVVGSRGYGPVRSVLLGSVSADLAARARCPLLVVPRGVTQPLGRLGADPVSTEPAR